LRNKHYLIYYSRDKKGRLQRVPIPLKYAYMFVTAAVIGAFTITGIAGSYTRMLMKTARFNQVQTEHEALRRDYKNLEQVARQKDVQAASLGSLVTQFTRISGLYHPRISAAGIATSAGHSLPASATGTTSADNPDGEFTEAIYIQRMQDLDALMSQAISGNATGRLHLSLGEGLSTADSINVAYAPSLWPIEGRITSSFGQREDPFNGEGTFHDGIDISAPIGTPVHAPADGTVVSAAFGNGYGREVILDHGHGVTTVYGHLSGFSVVPGQQVSRGDVIGYVGDSGRATGAHLHYEVRINDQPVNPHKYLRETMAQLTVGDAKTGM
jgi:murein DD-endopeptidase MepM/ murein hydrolase activator NlpD